MVERFRDVEERRPCREDLQSRLERHPHLRARLEGLLDIIDNAGDDIEKASAAEQRVMEELRRMGNEALHCWAENQERKKAEKLEQSEAQVNKKAKKNSTGTRASEG
jgi:histidinol dehydrogenase